MRLLVYHFYGKIIQRESHARFFSLTWEARGLVSRPFSTPELFSFPHDGGREELWEALERIRF